MNSGNPTIQVRGMGQVMLLASNTQRTAGFYKETLGFTESSDQMLSPGVTLVAGDASIYISDGGEAREMPDDRRAGFHIALMVASVREAYERGRTSGVSIVVDYEGNEHFGSFSLLDPDGVAIEMWGRP